MTLTVIVSRNSPLCGQKSGTLEINWTAKHIGKSGASSPQKTVGSVRGSSIVTVRNVPSGFEYSGDPRTKYKVVSHTTGLEELSALAARADL